MRYLFGFMCVLALGVMPMVGCGETEGAGGSGGDAGTGGVGGDGGTGGVVSCMDNVCPCSEAGIRAAIAEGGGPFTFDCDGPTVLVIEGGIKIDNVVALDGEGNLTIDGNGIVATDGDSVDLIAVVDGATAEIRGFTIIVKSRTHNGRDDGLIRNGGTLVLFESSISTRDRGYTGIWNLNGTLTLQGSTVSDAGILSIGPPDTGNLTIVNSTVSGGGLAVCGGTIAIVSSTLTTDDNGLYFDLNSRDCDGSVAIANSVVDGGCIITTRSAERVVSLGHNIESSDTTCGFDQPTDQVSVGAADLKLGPLRDNGGPTETHAPWAGSVAIDHIPAVDCEVTEDQRGQPRPEPGGTMCDVGAFEVQP